MLEIRVEQLATWLSEERIDEFIALVREILPSSPDPETALTQLAHLAEMSGNTRWLLEYLIDDPAAFESLLILLGGSNFAARTLSLHPEYLEFLVDREKLAQPKGLTNFLQDLSSSMELFRSPVAKWNAIRRFRRRETVRLIAADLLGLLDLPTLTAELSDLSEAILKVGLKLLPPEGNCRVLVVAFGKLGARELNYSSDIDLVLFYEGSSFAAERWAQKFVSTLSEVSEYGRLYRVDLRLRPYGSAGPIALPLDAAIAYYESQSEPSDRLALIKARLVAGDEELGGKFETFRKSFVFNSPLEPEELAWLLRLKGRTEDAFATEGAVKHGLGGIRDVEMTVQFLQLAFAHSLPNLSVRDTLTALKNLHRNGLLNDDEFVALSEGYMFLRRLEHMLQIAEDLPLQSLPDDKRELDRLARCMGLTDSRTLLDKFEVVTKQVRQVYESVTSELAKTLGVSDSVLVSLNIASGFDMEESSIKAFGFSQTREAQRRLMRLVHGDAISGLRWRERVRVVKVLPTLLESLSRTPDPDVALSRLEWLLSSLGPRHIVLESLSGNPIAIRALTLVASLSEPLCQLAVRHPESLEAILSGAIQVSSPEELKREVEKELSRQISEVGSSWEDFANLLRRLKGRFTLPLGFAHLCGLVDGEFAAQTLSAIADAVVGEALKYLLSLAKFEGLRVAAFAFGGWGSNELHFGSDLDISFAHKGRQLDSEEFVRNLRSLLGDLTEEGFAYRLDLRLRPTGQEGALSSDLEAWEGFAGSKFEIWMAIAWTRLRSAAGDFELSEKIAHAVRQRLYERPLTNEHWAELKALLVRIRNEHRPPKGVVDLKHNEGALWDIELAVTETQLRDGHRLEPLRSSSVRKVLRELSAIDKNWEQVSFAYNVLRQWRLWLSWIAPDQPPRFVAGDNIERLLAWLDANPKPLTQEQVIPTEETVEKWREKWRGVTGAVTMLKGGDKE
ncbi:MAG: hypothetical protein N3B10_08160 [Armatimonadetes bacterium]|nr:hypothetical protein [Armatimonadota bacterium]